MRRGIRRSKRVSLFLRSNEWDAVRIAVEFSCSQTKNTESKRGEESGVGEGGKVAEQRRICQNVPLSSYGRWDGLDNTYMHC